MTKAAIVAFRADASLDIGTGHVMRCLTLADELVREGAATCHFICREHPGNLIELIRNKGHQVYSLPVISERNESDPAEHLAHAAWLGSNQQADAKACTRILKKIKPDWLIVDHYALDIRWEKALAPYYKKLMAIDDLADREHSCDLLLDQTFGRNSSDYQHLTPETCVRLCGAQYALLRPEFAQWREYSLDRRKSGKLEHLLINLGGVDKDNITSQVLIALKACEIPRECHITVVMGATAPWTGYVSTLAAKMPWRTDVRIGVSNMAELMASSDLAIGAAGSTIWERSCLGIPTFMIVVADNQKFAAKQLAQTGALEILTLGCDFEQSLVELIRKYRRTTGTLRAMSLAARGITKGNGASMVTKKLRHIGNIDDC